MKLIDLSLQRDAKACCSSVDWLETSQSLTRLMLQLASPKQLKHSLDELGWITVTPFEQNIWSGFLPGELVWRRVVSFFVDGVFWLRATVLIPQSSLKTAAGVALQYCGAKSLGWVLFSDPGLDRQSLSCERKGLELIRHGLYVFYSLPLVVSECFSQVLWREKLP
jgi:chorismate-pyruvate lyase